VTICDISTTIYNQFFAISTVDLAMTIPQHIELVTGLPSIQREGYKNSNGMKGTLAIDPLVDI